MRSAVQKSSLNRQIILFEVLWGFAAVLFFLLFSASIGKAGYPKWYSYGTTLFELGAFLSAAVLCLRNAFSPQIVSGRRVWLGIGLGMAFYFMGNLIFSYWELVLGRDPDVTLADPFYIACYICLMVAMTLAVFERRLNLEGWQYGVIGAVGSIGVVVAVILLSSDGAKQAANLNPFQISPAFAVTRPIGTEPSLSNLPNQFLLAQATPKNSPIGGKKPVAKPIAKPVKATSLDDQPAAPAWVVATEKMLQPFKGILSFFYLMADTVLLIIATTLFMAFWGGRFAQSWRIIAAATFFLYLADAWFKFATTKLENYQSGGLLEVGWVLSAVLFAIGATLEYDLSQSRRGAGRRRA
jgi:hypothetical protein